MCHRRGWRRVAVAAVVLCFGAGRLSAQDVACTPGVKSYVGYSVPTQAGSPYTGTLRVTFGRKLGDGNVIHGVSRTRQARDSTGRVRMETALGCVVDGSGKPYVRNYVRIADPYAKTYMDWMEGGSQAKTVTLRSGPELSIKNYVPATNPPAPTGIVSERALAGSPGKTVRTETLGTKVISNVLVEGTRISTITAKGAAGNASAIVTFNEVWRSKELGVTMAQLTDDPEQGRTEMVMEEFSRKDPDPAMFAAPAGATVLDKRKAADGR